MAGIDERGWNRQARTRFDSIAAWIAASQIVLEGKPFSFTGHEYLLEPYQDNHPCTVHLKGTQMGITTMAMLKAFYQALYREYKGILYLFPSKEDVQDFSKTRISLLLEENEDTLGQWLKSTDSTTVKRIGNTFLYFRGMRSRLGLKSIPVDLIVFDELDEAPQDRVDMATKRLSHSEFKEQVYLSNPTYPDYGIDRLFQDTDQRYWLLRCPGCGHWNDLVGIFMEAVPPETPRCFRETADGVLRVCEKCGGELDPAQGRWVAKRPAVLERRGRQYSQLYSNLVSPAEILRDYRTARNLPQFYNLVVGVAYVEAYHRLGVEEVLGCCGDEGLAAAAPGPCFMGVDQGKDLHVVIGQGHWQRPGQVVHLGVYRDWRDLDRLMQVFRVARGVVDGLPETRNAREFAERHRGKVYLSFYQEHRKGYYAWNERDLTVASNRTESLDACAAQFRGSRPLLLPRESEPVRELARHLHNLAKELDEDERTGAKRYVYRKLGPDHFAHALNYETMARQFALSSALAGCDLS